MRKKKTERGEEYSEKLKNIDVRMKPPEEITKEQRLEFKKKERGRMFLELFVLVIIILVIGLIVYFWDWQEFFQRFFP